MATMKTTASTILLLVFSLNIVFSFAFEVTFDNRALKIDGERKLILSGSIHYPRSTAEMWQPLIRKAKEGGLNTVETYVFWNAHEPQRRQYDFSGNLDLVRFIKTIQGEGLNAILRIGPYVCAEWSYGGFPVWLHSLPDIELRTDNGVYKNEMQTFTKLIVDKMRQENLFASQGGPIILAQIENEYGNVMWKYGNDGKNYINWCAKLAEGFNIGVPWLMCQQSDAPWPMISSCNGFYCDQFWPKKRTPKTWTENWVGWFKNWGGQDPHRTAEDVAFAVARFFQLGGTIHNYYMYHGGTNFGLTAGGPYITTSYDYDAPLDEYGNLNQPKWGHLKQLHLVLKSIEKLLTYGESSTTDYHNQRFATVFNYKGARVCFFSNEREDYTFNFEGNHFYVPEWSVSIVDDCYTEVYNTAKVNAQTSIMVKKPNAADDFEEPFKLKWAWRPEHSLHLDKSGYFKGSSLISQRLLDQKRATNGTSDYLWLMTSFEHNESDPQWSKSKTRDIVLQVHTYGHIVHAFVNGKHVGSQWAKYSHYEFTMETPIKLKHGTNSITLCSVTVGLANYGEFFDEVKVGIHGPVKVLVRDKNGAIEATKDISSNRWVYKNGLHGEDLGLYQVHPRHDHGWKEPNLPTNRMFIWYKTTFKAPMGDDPVVVDLQGLGKGTAWVNDHNIGRYWPSYLAPEDGCSIGCDYRQTYSSGKCLSNCGQPTQRWYHIPREYLKDDGNVLVLFEEFGGTPDLVSIETVTIGKICANAYEGSTLELSCQGGKKISQINFASFGLPEGSCGSFGRGECEAENTLSIIRSTCLGKPSCAGLTLIDWLLKLFVNFIVGSLLMHCALGFDFCFFASGLGKTSCFTWNF